MISSDLFLSVVEAHKGIIYKIAHSYCSDPEDRKDLVQEIIVQLWRSLHRYNDQYKYSTWIYRVSLNTAISFYRKQSHHKKIVSDLPAGILYETPLAGTGPEQNDLDLLQQFIADLREFDKALMLLYLEEKSHKEMASIMGISETNVATRIGRIKQQLKQNFAIVKDR
ncbi:RNA polymerase sigma factor [Sediminibacterium ginsengisoli]|nr:sigma-70 family RNA polymerase sigma factor [Sediminibacterium ginsengisoli]